MVDSGARFETFQDGMQPHSTLEERARRCPPEQRPAPAVLEGKVADAWVRGGLSWRVAVSHLATAVALALFLFTSASADETPGSANECVIGLMAGDQGTQRLAALHGPGFTPRSHRGGHGQVIVGEDPVYLSHLGVLWFHPELHPHNFQVIVEADFEKGENDPQQAYVEDRQKHGDQRLYTLQPAEAFVITDLISTGPEPSPLRAFKGHIIRGHFERFTTEEAFREAQVAADVDVDIKKVVYFREFDPERAKLPQLEYLLFGRGSDLFLAHLISSPPPDFDQLLPAEINGHAFTDDELSQGLKVTFRERANSVGARFRAGEQVSCEFPVAGAAEPVALTLKAGEDIYCEEGELESTVDRDAVGRPVFPPFRTCRP